MRKTILLFTIFLTITYGQNGAKYLIITHDNFYDAILPLAQWKHKKGVPTKVVKLSDLNATPESIIRIKNYIINAYNTWSPRPEYILLVGGPQFIRSNQNKYDDYFSDVSGNYLMELSVGRFPCSTATQCSVMVNKTLGYERATFLSDTLWYKKGTGIVREDGAEHPDTVYWNNIRYVFSLWQSAGYTHIDSFSKFRGDSARHVESAITDGRAIVVFRGQGVANWWSPFEINVNRINNGYKLPIIVSGTCATINLAPNTPSYLGENFLKAGSVTTPNGAVGFVGSTNTESSTGLAVLRGVVAINFIKAIFAEQIYKIGDALKRAKFILDSLQLPNYTIIRYREWNLLGDPELSCWTDVPKQLTVTYDSVIGTGQQTFTVTVQQNTNPVPNALVCIMQDTLIYQSDYTNNFGQVSFSINPQTIGSMSLTVTAHNYCPYEGIV
ncbi:MAG: C25 family cysteine peptidase, partial [candidate division WOR-3 bacterium]